jgi:hypothetical protein
MQRHLACDCCEGFRHCASDLADDSYTATLASDARPDVFGDRHLGSPPPANGGRYEPETGRKAALDEIFGTWKSDGELLSRALAPIAPCRCQPERPCAPFYQQ